jgi:cytochrome c biogenesis protein CcmG, thiol:disulfide interchange protein DsbE
MRARQRLFLIGFVLLTLGAAGGPAFASADVGQPAPALIVPELSGQTFDLSTLRGKVVLVNFWATWCPPCRKEIPALDAFYKQYHAKGLELIGVSVDRPHDRKDVEQMMLTLSYPIAMLDDAKDNGFGDPATLPETFVIDSNGVIRARFVPDENGVTAQSLAAAVLPLLPQQTSATAPAPKSGTQ